MDFDTRHEARIPQVRRQADDLKVALMELIATSDTWIPAATAFVEEYRAGSVLTELRRQLVVPRGFARLLWFARTDCSSIRRIEPRLQSLREILARA